jgi:hypothetical protein
MYKYMYIQTNTNQTNKRAHEITRLLKPVETRPSVFSIDRYWCVRFTSEVNSSMVIYHPSKEPVLGFGVDAILKGWSQMEMCRLTRMKPEECSWMNTGPKKSAATTNNKRNLNDGTNSVHEQRIPSGCSNGGCKAVKRVTAGGWT